MTDGELCTRLYEMDKRLSIHEAIQKKDVENVATALRIQASEYERRLEILNGEAGRLREMQSSYLPREVWQNASNEIMKEIRELKAYRDRSLGQQALVAIIIPVIISFLVMWFGKR